MPALKPSHIFVTDEEDAAITAAAMSDPDNPPLDEDWFARARPAREVLPEIFGADVAAQMLKPRGRPPLDNPKRAITLRLSPHVLSAFKATGKGWQTRINEVLCEAVAQGRV